LIFKGFSLSKRVIKKVKKEKEVNQAVDNLEN